MVIKSEKNFVSLFTGVGGLDIGLEKAGFKSSLCVECNSDCLKTLSINRPHWKISEPNDISLIDPDSLLRQSSLLVGEMDLLAGGAPCQPFSNASYWKTGDSKRLSDHRASTIFHFMDIVKSTLPKVVLFENVKGISFKKKDEALQYIKSEFKKINKLNHTNYKPVIFLINAADYGVPQKRERVFIVAERNGQKLHMPKPTHVKFNNGSNKKNGINYFRTAWDAIGDLDSLQMENNRELKVKGKWAELLASIPEGKNYLWHTSKGGGQPIFGWRTRFWSFLLKLSKFEPSWTIQASPGPAIGPFHWKNRLLSTRELCRLQTIPDDWKISGSYRESVKQIGNAVPPAIGELLGKQILHQFFDYDIAEGLMLIPSKRYTEGIEIEIPKKVPLKYKKLIGDHADHPGVGKGPMRRVIGVIL